MADIICKLDPEIILGHDTLNRAGTLTASLGRRVLIATEQAMHENNAIKRLLSILKEAGVEPILFDEISPQAAADTAGKIAGLAKGGRCDTIIGFGGTKAQAIARMAATVASSGKNIFNILDGAAVEKPTVSYLAIPTTGADPFLFAHSFIVLDPRDKIIKLVQSPKGICAAVIIDGNLYESMSAQHPSTAAFDGFCTAVEAYCSTKANFFSESLLEESILRYCKIIKAYSENSSVDPSSSLAHAGFLLAMGSAFSAPGVGTALAYAINGKFPVEKSWCATAMLPYILDKLIAARPEKMAKVASFMGEQVEGVATATAANMCAGAIRRYMDILRVPSKLGEFDLSLDSMVPVAEAARNLQFNAFSPWTAAFDDVYDIIKQAF